MIPTKTIQLDFWRHPTDILHLVHQGTLPSQIKIFGGTYIAE